jgi:hypothetical protein
LEEDKVSAGIMMDVQDHMQAEGFEIPTQDQATGSREEGGPLKISPDINKGFSTQDKIAFARAILADKSLLEEMSKVIGDSEREMINQLSRKIGLSNCEQEVLGIEQSKPHGNIPQKGRSLKEIKVQKKMSSCLMLISLTKKQSIQLRIEFLSPQVLIVPHQERGILLKKDEEEVFPGRKQKKAFFM